jgi:hypothetical protein
MNRMLSSSQADSAFDGNPHTGAMLREQLFPAFLENKVLQIERIPEHRERYPEMKDPSVVEVNKNQYIMYASIGSSLSQKWIIGRFEASNPSGVWKELPPVEFENLDGPEVCAPAIMVDSTHHESNWNMYVQTSCFSENGIIALATSKDGQHFIGHENAVMSKDTLEHHPHQIVGVYDAGISEVMVDGESHLCLLFSGYRKIGCGDIFMTIRKKNAHESSWNTARCILAQEDVPFHNSPSYEHFEWGLEGAKIIQLSPQCFLLVGVCFLPRPRTHIGTRQRVFFAISNSLEGPFIPLGSPFAPQGQNGMGEHGHPDTLLLGQEMYIYYQERRGDGQPWYLRLARYDLPQLQFYFQKILEELMPMHHPKKPVQDKPTSPASRKTPSAQSVSSFAP